MLDRGEAELKASSEVNMDEQGALEQVGRAGHNQASVGYSSPCVYIVHVRFRLHSRMVLLL